MLSLVGNENRVRQNKNKNLIRKYSAQNTVARKSVRMLIKEFVLVLSALGCVSAGRF